MMDYELLATMLENYKRLYTEHCHNDNPHFKQHIIEFDIDPAITWATRRAEVDEEVRKQYE